MTFTTPNLLTLFRIATVPVLVCLLLFPGPVPSAVAAGIFFIATLSDFFDGYIARSYNSGSTLGKLLDPLADKLLVAAVLVMLAGIARAPRIPAWIVVVLITREITVTSLRAMLAIQGHVLAAGELGKYKMVLQSIALQGLLIHYTYFHINFFAAGYFILWIAMAVSIWSGVDYFVRAFGLINSKPPSIKRAAV